VRREYVFPVKDAKNVTHFPKNRTPKARVAFPAETDIANRCDSKI